MSDQFNFEENAESDDPLKKSPEGAIETDADEFNFENLEVEESTGQVEFEDGDFDFASLEKNSEDSEQSPLASSEPDGTEADVLEEQSGDALGDTEILKESPISESDFPQTLDSSQEVSGLETPDAKAAENVEFFNDPVEQPTPDLTGNVEAANSLGSQRDEIDLEQAPEESLDPSAETAIYKSDPEGDSELPGAAMEQGTTDLTRNPPETMDVSQPQQSDQAPVLEGDESFAGLDEEDHQAAIDARVDQTGVEEGSLPENTGNIPLAAQQEVQPEGGFPESVPVGVPIAPQSVEPSAFDFGETAPAAAQPAGSPQEAYGMADSEDQFDFPTEDPGTEGPVAYGAGYSGDIPSMAPLKKKKKKSTGRLIVASIVGGFIGVPLGYLIMLWLGGQDFLQVTRFMPSFMVPSRHNVSSDFDEIPSSDVNDFSAPKMPDLSDIDTSKSPFGFGSEEKKPNKKPSEPDKSGSLAAENKTAKRSEPEPEDLVVGSPKVETPGVDLPGLGEPSTSAPEVDLPKIEVPTVEPPKTEDPLVATNPVPPQTNPPVEEPIDVPVVKEPKVEQPNVVIPKVEEPAITLPTIEEPKVELPTIEEPKIEEPTVEEPKVEEPETTRPAVGLPTVEPPAPEPAKTAPEDPGVDLPKIDPPSAEPLVPEPKKVDPVTTDPAPKVTLPEVKVPVEPPLSEPEPAEPKTEPSTEAIKPRLVNAPKLDDTRLSSSRQEAAKALTGLVEGSVKDSQYQRPKILAFRKYCELGDQLGLAAGNGDAAQAIPDKQQILDDLKSIGESDQALLDIGFIASKWIPSAKRSGSGVLLAGSVESLARQGDFYAMQVKLSGGDSIVTVLTDHEPTVAQGDTTVVLGRIVADPQENLRGYDGMQKQIVWLGLQSKVNP